MPLAIVQQQQSGHGTGDLSTLDGEPRVAEFRGILCPGKCPPEVSVAAARPGRSFTLKFDNLLWCWHNEPADIRLFKRGKELS